MRAKQMFFENLHSLKLTANAPENQGLQDEMFFQTTFFQVLLVSGSVWEVKVNQKGCRYLLVAWNF